MFIEHRTYTVKPGHVAEYLDDYDAFPILGLTRRWYG
jgi:hypothetical protein